MLTNTIRAVNQTIDNLRLKRKLYKHFGQYTIETYVPWGVGHLLEIVVHGTWLYLYVNSDGDFESITYAHFRTLLNIYIHNQTLSIK